MTEEGNTKSARLAVIGAASALALGAIGLAVVAPHGGSGVSLGEPIPTGVSGTPTTTTTTPSKAVPSITGPAPLPPEEADLPG